MRQRIWRRLFAAAVGALALAGSASAQQLPPIPNPAVAQPAPGPTAPTVNFPTTPGAAAGTVVAPTPGATVIPGGTAGCASCGAAGGHHALTAARGFVMEKSGGYYGTDCSFGQKCNNGCGSLRSDLGFVLGSCNSFFAPCGPRPLSCGFGHCPTPVYGTGPCGPFNPCVYDSYLNH